MTVSQQRVPRGVSPSGVSLVSISASPGVEGVVARDTVITDDFVRRRADSRDAEAAYYRPPGHPTAAGPWALAITETCSGKWLPTRPRWPSGYRPRTQQREERAQRSGETTPSATAEPIP
jgi:hypothetical protein